MSGTWARRKGESGRGRTSDESAICSSRCAGDLASSVMRYSIGERKRGYEHLEIRLRNVAHQQLEVRNLLGLAPRYVLADLSAGNGGGTSRLTQPARTPGSHRASRWRRRFRDRSD